MSKWHEKNVQPNNFSKVHENVSEFWKEISCGIFKFLFPHFAIVNFPTQLFTVRGEFECENVRKRKGIFCYNRIYHRHTMTYVQIDIYTLVHKYHF